MSAAGRRSHAAGGARIWKHWLRGQARSGRRRPAPMFGSSFFGSDGDAEWGAAMVASLRRMTPIQSGPSATVATTRTRFTRIHQNGHDIFYNDDSRRRPVPRSSRGSAEPGRGLSASVRQRRAAEIAEYLATDGMSIRSTSCCRRSLIAELTYTRKTELTYQRVPRRSRSSTAASAVGLSPAMQAAASRAGGHHNGLDATRKRGCLSTSRSKRSKELPKERQEHRGNRDRDEANLRRLFPISQHQWSSPLRGKLNVGESSPSKLSRIL